VSPGLRPGWRGLLGPGALAWILAAGAAPAQQVVIHNGLAPPAAENVIDAADAYGSHDVFVRNVGCGETFPYDAPCANPGAATQVSLVEGGRVGFQLGVYDTSSVAVSGGSAGNLRAHDSASVSVSGGSVDNTLEVNDSATIVLSDGSVGQFVYTYDAANLAIQGGSVATVFVAGASTLTVTGGTLGSVSGHGYSEILVDGGSVASFVTSIFESRVRFTGGSIAGILAANESGEVVWSGGSLGGSVIAYGDSSIRVRGDGFAVDGVPVAYGPLADPEGVLSGMLASGQPFSNPICHSGCLDDFNVPATGLITVPEPGRALLGPAALLALGGLSRRARVGRRPRAPRRAPPCAPGPPPRPAVPSACRPASASGRRSSRRTWLHAPRCRARGGSA
jgi:hypothetical protein